MANMISDIFFDLDHTLWDFEKNSALAFQSVFDKYNIEADLDNFLFHYIPINVRYWELFRRDEISKEEMRMGRLRDAFHLMDFPVEEDILTVLSDEYIEHLPNHNYLFDGTIAILDYLKPKYNLHIITNGFDHVQERKLSGSNIRHYFKTITNSEMAGVKKPNPIIFTYALDKAQAKKETSIMIGDCLEADVFGALNSGLDAIFFNSNRIVIDHDVKQINHLSDLKNYL